MKQNKKLKINVIVVFTCALLLYGCASENDEFVDYGKVTSEKKLGGTDYTPGSSTLVGGLAGAGSGALVGAGAGLVAGVLWGTVTVPYVFYPISVPSCAVVGTISGTAVGGVIGASLGATGGYIYGINEQGYGVCEYKVQPKKDKTNIIEIKQNSKKIFNKGTMVKIYKDKKDGFYPLGYHIEEIT